MSTSVSVQGRELIAVWTQVDRGIGAFVLQLAEFDASRAWAEDGYASCASWLTDKCDVARSTAHEKLKVAHELTRRHAVRVAFEGGLSYTKGAAADSPGGGGSGTRRGVRGACAH